MDGDAVGDRLILPQCRLSSLHISDTGYAVDDALVMAVVGAWF